MKLEIVHPNSYDIATRGINKGDIFEIEHERISQDVPKGTCYLFTSSNGKASLAYHSEVKLIKD